MPDILGKIDTVVSSIRVHAPLAMQQVRDNLKIPSIICRRAAAHRNSWGAVLNAVVIIDRVDDAAMADAIRRYRRRIIRSAVTHARRENRWNIAAHLPLGFAQVAVIQRDYRQRRLFGFGTGKDLVCTVRFQRLRRIKSPDIVGSTIETTGRWRIAWNRAWLERNGKPTTGTDYFTRP